jgi:putative membrane protein
MKSHLLATLAAGAIALGTLSGTAIAHGDVGDRSGSRSGTGLSSRDRNLIRSDSRFIGSDSRFIGSDSRNRGFVASDTLLSSRDRRFIRKAARGAYFEIAAGQLAATKAVTPEVQALGTRLAADHTTGLASIAALAETHDVLLPETMSNDQQDELADVSSLDGLDFDVAFTELAKHDHREDIADFRREARKGRNAEIRAFAKAAIPVLKEHLAAAKATNDVVEQQQEAQEQAIDEG